MPSALIGIADAVVVFLDAGSFTESITPSRAVHVATDLKDIKTAMVYVIPKSSGISIADRTKDFVTYAVSLAVMKKIDPDDIAQVDAMLVLVEQIIAELNRKTILDPAVSFVSIENDPAYDADHLDQFRQFTSIVTVTYRARK